MSKICQITGKKAMIGNNVSHSKRRTKKGLDAALNDAVAKGYCDWKSIKVIG
ncbi:MAG: hypothetical protein KHX11_21410 [Bacteroides cellulosilyticus]|nr:hypothetical protein [Bacteroides cellulosilyticus]